MILDSVTGLRDVMAGKDYVLSEGLAVSLFLALRKQRLLTSLAARCDPRFAARAVALTKLRGALFQSRVLLHPGFASACQSVDFQREERPRSPRMTRYYLL